MPADQSAPALPLHQRRRKSLNRRMRLWLTRSSLMSPRQWLRQVVFWVGAVLVAAVAIAFAAAANGATALFLGLLEGRPWLALVVSPAGFALAVLLTQRVFQAAQGSGIPQVIASLQMVDQRVIARVLSLRIAAGKILLTLLGLASGASIGREGPTVQVGAAIMQALGAYLRLPRVDMQRALVLAGGPPASRRRSTRRWPASCSRSRN